MFPAVIIALLVAFSSTAWVYDKSARRTGGNSRSSLIAAVVAGVAAFIVTLTVASLIDSALG